MITLEGPVSCKVDEKELKETIQSIKEPLEDDRVFSIEKYVNLPIKLYKDGKRFHSDGCATIYVSPGSVYLNVFYGEQTAYYDVSKWR